MNVAMVVTSTLALANPLALEDVLRSVDAYHPMVMAAREQVDVARGERLSAEGAFDVYLGAKGGGYAAGYYDGVSSRLEIRQPTTVWGAKLYAAYRYGLDHPIYDGGKLTSDRGELVGGVRVPLWRDGPTDARRTALKTTGLGIEIAKLEAQTKIISTKLKAAMSFWKWVAAHEKLRIEASMQQIAQQRANGLRRRVERGDIAQIELVDNERLIVKRLEAVVEARREVQTRAFALSLFLRDDDGHPIVPHVGRAPDRIAPAERVPAFGLGVVERAFAARPDLARFDARRSRLRAELDLAENQRAPRIDVGVEGSKDLGDPRFYGPDPKEQTRNETALGLTLSFSWPVQQRKARGKAQATAAKIRVVEAKQRFIRDSIAMEVQDAWSASETARARLDLAVRTLDLTRTVEAAERRRFELGASSILQVNLREEASAKAAKDVVDAVVESHTAAAWFKAVTATMQKWDEVRKEESMIKPKLPTAPEGWTFLTNHAHVLFCLASDPTLRLRDVADMVGITERATQRIVAELAEEGYITVRKDGRRNTYSIREKKRLRHPIESNATIKNLLEVTRAKD